MAKMYKFSMAKYGHSIELAYNRLWNIAYDMERDASRSGEEVEKAEQRADKAAEIYDKALNAKVIAQVRGGWIIEVDGKTYGELKRLAEFGEGIREAMNAV